ncbi:protein disulfide-isomerase A5-like isoform X1 [Cimex lectularius]|uniref:Thioredoxin domain-containing protein n=1 Tax=Cimex lectularius TaxID=79782 RepID=A0A8I6TK54_CIMLE|nr:protein disulfide-isomerase A5-like isoform X1 [Cimex lectularius]XP_014255260.1 protein disulfide-isomerase A5-like isoform X1 [Cimex lectularius]XP_024082851.1 protein disulfide-isomerase A5-like isoform X1 [Cimex lectularius]
MTHIFGPTIKRICTRYRKFFISRHNSTYCVSVSSYAKNFKSAHIRRNFATKLLESNRALIKADCLFKNEHPGCRDNRFAIVRQYSEGEFDVPELKGKAFFKYLQERKHLFAFFYDPFCPHCRKAKPEFLKVAQQIDVPCAKVDCTENEWLCKTLKIESLPTFRYFTTDNTKVSWATFSGDRVSNNLINFVNEELKSGGNVSKFEGLTKRYYSTVSSYANENLLNITSENLNQQLEGRNVLVLFYNSYSILLLACKDCHNIINLLTQASKVVDRNTGYFAICNAEKNPAITEKLTIYKFPLLKYFKNGHYVMDFQEEIKLENLIAFMNTMKPKIFSAKLTHSEKKSLWRGIDGADHIVHITNETLVQSLQKYPSLLIFFYACWSRSCINLKHVYANAAKKLDPKYGRLAACDAEDNIDVADQLLVSHFPTFKYFRNGHYLTDYKGERSEESLLKFMQEPGKLGYVKVENKIKPSYSVLSLTGNIPPYWIDVLGAESLIFLTDYNFKSVLQSYRTVLVMFYVPWCKACSLMKKEYGKAAFSLPAEWNVAIAACDAEENNYVADKFLVTKLPTMKIFKNGEYVEDYLGRRKEQDMLRFVKEVSMRNSNIKPTYNVTNYTAVVPNMGTMLVFWNDVEGGTDVVLMNENNFNMFLDQEKPLLIMFYNPDGDHMDSVRREFGLAAKNLPKEIGLLGAYEYKESDPICNFYDVYYQDLPTFKHFHRGKFVSNYTGIRSADSFLKFMGTAGVAVSNIQTK